MDQTPLFYAGHYRSKDLFELLIKEGADPNITYGEKLLLIKEINF